MTHDKPFLPLEVCQDTLEILTWHLFDYAGMFPPAALPFEAAIRESTALSTALLRPHLVGSDFVISSAHLPLLRRKSPREWGFSHNPTVCVLASTPPSTTIQAASELIQSRFSDDSHFAVQSIEVRTSPEEVADTISHYASFCASANVLLAVEPDLSGSSWRIHLETCVNHLLAIRQQVPRSCLKCRCSGPTGISADILSVVVRVIGSQSLHFKTTAGLHHPIVEKERYDNQVGFLNLAAAVMFYRVLGESVDLETTERLLTNVKPEALTFGTSLTFENLSISRGQLLEAKRRAHFSIGSCSLREPDDDLERIFPRG